ncbi:MAG: peptidoglycan recognition family protein [Verrucomicrobiota bacterium]
MCVPHIPIRISQHGPIDATPLALIPALVLAAMLLPLTVLHAELTDAEKKTSFLNSQSKGKESNLSPSSHSSHSKASPSKTPSKTPPPKSSSKSSQGKKSSPGSSSSKGSDQNAAKHSSPHSKTHHRPHSGQAQHAHPQSTSEKTSPSISASASASASASGSGPRADTLNPTTLSSQALNHQSSIPQTVHAHASPSLPTTLPLPRGANPSAPITIEKSGVETAQGLEPVPAQQSPRHGWDWLFGPRKSYTYLSPSVRAAIDRAAVRRGRWKYIVVHNSGTREGNARIFDIYHLRVRHMKNGLAYHFVIGDGHGSGDGTVEIGHRWTAQLNGGHVASDYLNDIALGICLVGDFNRDLPTKAQIGALDELVGYLRDRVGKSQGRKAIVHAHKEINPKPTDCPGDRFPYSWLHARFGNAH